MTTLLEVLASATFAIYGVPATDWSGDAFVGDVARGTAVRSVQLVYLSPDGISNGVAVSSLDATHLVDADPLTTHLLPFISRFDPARVVARAGKRRFASFQPAEFTTRDLVVAIAGEQTGATLYTHREMPVQLLRAAVRKGAAITDLGIMAWRLDARTYAPATRAVDVRFAKEFDAHGSPLYPPPGWGTGDEDPTVRDEPRD